MSNVLSLVNIGKSFPQPDGKLEILRGVDLQISAGESVALVGASGSGKTTLLQIAGLLSTATSGEVLFKEQNVKSLNESKLTVLRGLEIGFIYQFHHLLPEFSALENVVLPQLVVGKDKKSAISSAKELLDEFGLADRFSHRPAQLSGGEMQRVAIARALANEPSLLLADEPTGNLDDSTSSIVFDLLMRAVSQRNMSALIATHDRNLASKMSRILSLEDGLIS